MNKLGRPRAIFPENLSPEVHEFRRLRLGLSKRKYAEKIGMHHNTYIRRTETTVHLKSAEGGQTPKRSEALDHVTVAREFLKLRPQYIQSLQQDLELAQSAVVAAKARVAEIKRILVEMGDVRSLKLEAAGVKSRRTAG